MKGPFFAVFIWGTIFGSLIGGAIGMIREPCPPEQCPVDYLDSQDPSDQTRALRALREAEELPEEAVNAVGYLALPFNKNTPEVVGLAGEVLAAHGEVELLRDAFRLSKPISIDPRLSPLSVALWPSILRACEEQQGCAVDSTDWGRTWVTWLDGTVSSPVQWRATMSTDNGTTHKRWTAPHERP